MRYFHEFSRKVNYDLDFTEAMMFALTSDIDRYENFIQRNIDTSEFTELRKKTKNSIFSYILSTRVSEATEFDKEDVIKLGAQILRETEFLLDYSTIDLIRFMNLLVERKKLSEDDFKEIADIIKKQNDLDYKMKSLK